VLVPETPLPEPLDSAAFVEAAAARVEALRLDTIVVGRAVVMTKVELPEIMVDVIIVEVEKVEKAGMTIPTLPTTGTFCDAATENETPMLCPPAVIVLADGSKEDDLKKNLLALCNNGAVIKHLR